MASERVIIGDHGWLYRSRAHPGASATGHAAKQTAFWTEYLKQIDKSMGGRNTRTSVMLVPDKQAIIEEFLPENEQIKAECDAVTSDVESLMTIGHGLRSGLLISPRAALINGQDRLRTFPKSDSCWSDLGAYLSLKEASRAFDLDLTTDSANWRWMDRPHRGNLRKFTRYSRNDSRTTIDPQISPVFDNKLDEVGRIAVAHNAAALLPARCAIIGNCFSESGLFQVAAHIFTDVFFCYAPTFDACFARCVGADYVLWQLAERSIGYMPEIVVTKNGSVLGATQQLLSMASSKAAELDEKIEQYAFADSIPHLVLQRAILAVRSGRIAEGKRIWEKLEVQALSAEFYAAWAFAQRSVGDERCAEDLFRRARAMAPDNVSYGIHYALSQLKNGRVEEYRAYIDSLDGDH